MVPFEATGMGQNSATLLTIRAGTVRGIPSFMGQARAHNMFITDTALAFVCPAKSEKMAIAMIRVAMGNWLTSCLHFKVSAIRKKKVLTCPSRCDAGMPNLRYKDQHLIHHPSYWWYQKSWLLRFPALPKVVPPPPRTMSSLPPLQC